ncbi:MAG: glycosyl hydrolase family 65 protein [Phycisphaerae bacterium]
MAKIPQKHFEVHPWQVVERGFDPSHSRISESMFCLANEAMGVRGYFEEGYSGATLLGSYFNGLFEEMDVIHPQVFKGFLTRTNFSVNAVDWLHTRIKVAGETLDLARSKFSDFVRTLDLKNGLMTRSFIWNIKGGKKLRLTFQRFLSMVDGDRGFQRIVLEPLNFTGSAAVTIGLDFNTVHEIASGWTQTESTGSADAAKGINFWTCPKMGKAGKGLAVLGKTTSTGQYVFSSFRLDCTSGIKAKMVKGEKCIGQALTVPLKKGQAATIEKIVVNRWFGTKPMPEAKAWAAGVKLASARPTLTFDAALAQQTAHWADKWKTLDVQIDGEPEIQQGMRFSIYQLYQTYHGGSERFNIPCKGLTAEVYYGWIFWDTETYCLPFYIFTDPAAARKLLVYRYNHLAGAKRRAKELGCEGARYPFCTLDGNESCHTWQHGDLEIHVGEAVFYALWLYVRHSGDKEFLYREGIEMLLELSRYYASRGEFSPKKGDFGFYGVMGPDEYHMMVNHNTYTNVMAKKLFEYTLDVMNEMKSAAPDKLAAATKKFGLREHEADRWAQMAANMRICKDQATGIYEQHDGYFDLPEVDVKHLPVEQIPIYKNWPYIKIFRYNMVKQPDFLMLPLFFSRDYTPAEKRANYEYYEARTIHESSLSPGVHSILATELGKMDQAVEFLRYMARLDLDNYNRNSEQGLHTTAMSGAWMSAVYGLGGMRTDGEKLSFRPALPAELKGLRFRIVHHGSTIEVALSGQAATFKLIEGPEQTIEVYGRDVNVTAQGTTIPLEK